MNWIVNTYWPEVRGNVYAILPCAVVAFLWLRSKHAAIQAAHERLHGKLDDVLDKWDPDSDGGMSDVLDRLDENTPHGIGAIREDLKHIKP